jgi:hypothetical protein
MPRKLTVEHPAMPVSPVHHGSYGEFSCVFFQANDRELIGSRDVLGQDLPQLPSVAAKVIQHDFAPTAGGYASWTVLTSSTGAVMSIRSGHEHQR